MVLVTWGEWGENCPIIRLQGNDLQRGSKQTNVIQSQYNMLNQTSPKNLLWSQYN
jgi:hypothetical protein